MSSCIRARSFFLILAILVIGGCGKSTPSAGPVAATPESEIPLKNEIPADKLSEVMTAHLKGLGFMERYDYRAAAKEFRKIQQLAPGWIPGAVNLSIALLNDVGNEQAQAKQSGHEFSGGKYAEPLALLKEVIKRDPENLHAHYCRGLVLEVNAENDGERQLTNDEFKFVTDRDPKDANAWYKYGSTLQSSKSPNQPASIDDADRLVEIYSKALDRNPYLVTAMYKLQQAYAWRRNQLQDEFARRPKEEKSDPEKRKALADAQRDLTQKQTALLALWQRINPMNIETGPGDTAEAFYGEAGKYASIVNPFSQPTPPAKAGPPPRFEQLAPIKITLPPGARWVKTADFTGPLAVIGRARERFGATIATFDANGDGRVDIFLASAVVGPKGVRDALLLNTGDGTFEDASERWGLPNDRASLGAAAADFDADRRIDLFLTGLDDNYLLRNMAGTKFEDVSAKSGVAEASALGLTARWLDIDQDGDLDLYVLNYTDRANLDKALDGDPASLPKVSNSAYRNDGRPPSSSGPPENWAPLAVSSDEGVVSEGLSLVLKPWPEADALLGPPAHYSAFAVTFLDSDRDLDLVLTADGELPIAVLNDRLGRFHTTSLKEIAAAGPISGLIVADFDKDGRADLTTLTVGGRVACWKNATDPASKPDSIHWQPWPIDAKAWRTGIATDLDLDTWSDLVGLPDPSDVPTMNWARNDGKRMVDQPIAIANLSKPSGFTLADLAGDSLLDLLMVSDGAPPSLARNLGNGAHWLALDLGGRWKVRPYHMRTNPQALGTRISLEGQGLHVTYDHNSPASGLGQSVGSILLGMGANPSAELVRFTWPDGVMQCELNKGADNRLLIFENTRKTGSCPVLFTWNGSQFVCLGDFLGGGGMGYLVTPGVYGQPDPDESVAIDADQLRPENGVFRLVVTEPMDEVAYLDQLRLEVIDRPPGVSVGLDERFAPEGTRPTGEIRAWTSLIEPLRATDLEGRDVSQRLKAFDRQTVDSFRLLPDWIGYAENHGIVLDFGDRLSRYRADQPLLLALAGWVEYPYSQTNYAAATSGLTLKPPTIERQQDDGSWKLIEPHAGYPAGLPRLTSLDLTGKLTGPRCVIRIQTNMECYWDQAFVAVRDKEAESAIRKSILPVTRAVLEHRGFTREASPDGRIPLLYDYRYVDPAPLALMAGKLTRLGDVSALLQTVDDQLCVVGPGDEARIEFDAAEIPALTEGWTRSYVLRSFGYCKDADPLTAGSDSVEPLPWRGMPPYPFTSPAERPTDKAYRAYLETYQTRPAGLRSPKK